MKRLTLAVILSALSALAFAQPFTSFKILSAAIATGAGATQAPLCSLRTFQATGTTSAGAGAAAIIIEGSNVAPSVDGTNVEWVTLGTITLTLATTKSGDGFVSHAPWRFVRARVSSISGTGASVDAYLGC